MAYGTLKFDTLTTSDTKNTSTDKSIDTSYLFNGIIKHWQDSNNGTGDYSVTITNAMGNINFTHGGMGGSATNNLINISQNRNNYVPTTTVSRYALTYANTSSYDSIFIGAQLFGDLA